MWRGRHSRTLASKLKQRQRKNKIKAYRKNSSLSDKPSYDNQKKKADATSAEPENCSRRKSEEKIDEEGSPLLAPASAKLPFVFIVKTFMHLWVILFLILYYLSCSTQYTPALRLPTVLIAVHAAEPSRGATSYFNPQLWWRWETRWGGWRSTKFLREWEK